MSDISESILQAIGNTPVVKLKNIVPDDCAEVYVKLEYFNPSGSYKDRMALSIIEGAEASGKLKPGMTVVECTGGSTGTSLALVCKAKGYRFRVVSSDAFAQEKLQSMRLFGAELELMPSDGGKITPDLIPRMIERAKQISEEGLSYQTKQFENTDAFTGYAHIGYEILSQIDKPIDAFCAVVGTAGMFTGVSQVLKKANSDIRLIILEPASAPLISTGVKGSHKVDGIGVGFVPPLLQYAVYDAVQTIEEANARQMAHRLAAEEGIFAGTSSGMNVVAAIALAKQLGPGKTVVTVACDSGMKYLASGLFE